MAVEITQRPLMPDLPRPIVVIGAGGIVRNAHLPAYKLAGFEVIGIFDKNTQAADLTAVEFGIPVVLDSLHEIVERFGTRPIYDLATPPSTYAEILDGLPSTASVVIQKPMGETLAQAEEIVQICDRKALKASVNFQLRYAPYVRAAKSLVAAGLIGDILDIDFKVNVFTPWANWPFLEQSPRMELVYHSIHYLDLIRDLLGAPSGVYARAIRHPHSPTLESSRSVVILD